MDFLEKAFFDIADPFVKLVNCSIEDITFSKGEMTLDISIEKIDGSLVSVSDCSRVTRKIREAILQNDPCPDCDYCINVGSVGLNRKLKTINDFVKFQGMMANIVVVFDGVDNINRFNGKIISVDGLNIVFECLKKNKTIELIIAYSCIRSAKLIV